MNDWILERIVKTTQEGNRKLIEYEIKKPDFSVEELVDDCQKFFYWLLDDVEEGDHNGLWINFSDEPIYFELNKFITFLESVVEDGIENDATLKTAMKWMTKLNPYKKFDLVRC